MIKICHVTNVHPPGDVRIFRKECVSLAKAGYDVSLVQQGGSYEKDGVHIVGFGELSGGRFKRMFHFSKLAYRKALEVDAELYHLHDPELLPYGLKLKRAGKKVIFDSHEDVPADIREKYWIPSPLRRLIAALYERYENRCLIKFDGAVGVTPHLCDRIRRSNPATEMITNYPVLVGDLPQPQFNNRKIVFPGLISSIWCIDTLVKALSKLDGVTLELRSGDEEHPYFDTLKELPGWSRVNYPGKVSHSEVLQLISECICGVALLDYCPNSGWKTGTLGNTKIFEYMMVGIPVVCTDFTLWKEIMEQYHCGICVNPKDADQIARAIRYLLEHPEEARQMGENGRMAVREHFNWSSEEQKLLRFYETILAQKAR